jgi:hypothetical protein
MNYYVITLRLIHIFTGVFWAGAAWMIAGFVEPAVRATGPEGGKFMRQLAGPGRLPFFMQAASGLNVLSGLLLYWRASGGLQTSWITSGPGLGYTVSSLAALAAFVLGFLIQGRAAERMAALGREIQAAGGPPNPAQIKEMQALQERIRQGGLVGGVLLAIAVIGMGVARYLWF